MSQFADLIYTFGVEAGRMGVSDECATELFVNVLGTLEWDSYNVDYNKDYEDECLRELREAFADLFPCKPNPYTYKEMKL